MMNTNADSIADTCDASRLWPQAALIGFTAALAYLLAPDAEDGSGLSLEIGVGDGRIARQVRQRRVPVLGLDIGARPLARFANYVGSGAASTLGLIQGDAVSLPFPDATFSSVYTVNLFQFVEEWERGLDEVKRVLRPGGQYINGTSSEVATDVSNHMEVGWETILKRNHLEVTARPGVRSRFLFDSALRERGASMENVPVCRWTEGYTPRHRLESMRMRLSSATWKIPDAVFTKCLFDYERWLKAQYGNLDADLELLREAALHVWRWA
ncbi:MAG TPA: class I SAM-dependent methyltransferase [Aggregatilineales bacterium]|nr:class I SAM-dependent methyltransferase [Aggregatilineales bacterium]